MKYILEYFRIEFLSLLAYKVNFLLEYINQIVAFMIKIQLWNAISASNSGKYDYSYYITYFLFAFIIAQFTTFNLSISDKIRSGDLSLDLLMPININIIEFSKIFANKIMTVLKFLPLFIILSLLFTKRIYYIKLDFWFVIFLVVGFIISYLIQFFINCIAFWFVDISAVKYIYSTTITVLSGALVPYEYMPYIIKKLFSHLPFQFFINAPIASLLKIYTIEEKCSYLILGMIYIILFAILNKLIFSVGIKKYTAVGG